MLKAVLFDFDGTLADTVPAILSTIEKVREQNNFDYGNTDLLPLIGKPLVDIGEVLVGKENAATFVSSYHEFYEDSCKNTISLYSGVREILAMLKENGVKIGVVTSKRRAALEMNIALLNCGEFFDLLFPADDQPKVKPARECAEAALALLGVTADEAVFVGDSLYDVCCGKNAEMISIGVTWGAGDTEAMAAAGSDYLLSTREELKEVLEMLMKKNA